MATWAAGHAGEVFERRAAPLEEGAVHTSTEIERVRFALELEPALMLEPVPLLELVLVLALSLIHI